MDKHSSQGNKTPKESYCCFMSAGSVSACSATTKWPKKATNAVLNLQKMYRNLVTFMFLKDFLKTQPVISGISGKLQRLIQKNFWG